MRNIGYTSKDLNERKIWKDEYAGDPSEDPRVLACNDYQMI